MKHLLYIFTFALILCSCKTNQRVQDESLLEQKKATTETTAPASTPAVTPVAPVSNSNVETPDIKGDVDQAPVVSKTESIEVLNNVENKTFKYYVISGSFSSQANAERFSKELEYKNFTSKVLKSNSTAYYRVSVGGFDNEDQARQLIYRVRSEYPEYKDTWLLKSN